MLCQVAGGVQLLLTDRSKGSTEGQTRCNVTSRNYSDPTRYNRPLELAKVARLYFWVFTRFLQHFTKLRCRNALSAVRPLQGYPGYCRVRFEIQTGTPFTARSC